MGSPRRVFTTSWMLLIVVVKAVTSALHTGTLSAHSMHSTHTVSHLKALMTESGNSRDRKNNTIGALGLLFL